MMSGSPDVWAAERSVWMQGRAGRACLAGLAGSCRTPIAALAEIAGERMRLRTMILTPDGAEVHETEREGLAADAVALGIDAGEDLKGRAGPHFFDEV